MININSDNLSGIKFDLIYWSILMIKKRNMNNDESKYSGTIQSIDDHWYYWSIFL